MKKFTPLIILPLLLLAAPALAQQSKGHDRLRPIAPCIVASGFNAAGQVDIVTTAGSVLLEHHGGVWYRVEIPAEACAMDVAHNALILLNGRPADGLPATLVAWLLAINLDQVTPLDPEEWLQAQDCFLNGNCSRLSQAHQAVASNLIERSKSVK